MRRANIVIAALAFCAVAAPLGAQLPSQHSQQQQQVLRELLARRLQVGQEKSDIPLMVTPQRVAPSDSLETITALMRARQSALRTSTVTSCPMPVARANSDSLEPMPVAASDPTRLERMPVAPATCDNPLNKK